ncbi:MAG TPA: prolyl oligopeptidase family serine peptidase [Thermoguttaceae bacterium]|nr:prolyl oligopeptidase family serine peptidase [Thermoguttaceae bacterium]
MNHALASVATVLRQSLAFLLPIGAWLAFAVPHASVLAQGSKQDYQRAASYGERTRDKVFRQNVRPTWFDGDARFWYRVDTGPEQYEFVLVDAEKGVRRPAFDHQRLAASLADASGEKVDPKQLPFRSISFSDDLSIVRFDAHGKHWQCDLEKYELTEAGQEPAAETQDTGVVGLDSVRPSRGTGDETPVRLVNETDGSEPPSTEPPRESHSHRRPDSSSTSSPDGRWQASIRDHNVLVKSQEGDEEFMLTSDGTEDDPYESRFSKSPDSKKLVVMQVRAGESRQIHLIDSSPDDQLQPKLLTIDYAKPGDRMPLPRPRLFDLQTRSQIEVREELFPNAWSISDLRWSPDSRSFTFFYNQRGHQVLRIVEVDAKSGAARAVVDEQSPTFVDYSGKRFTHYLDKTGEILWMSERDGWNHLYLYDAKKGKVKNRITCGRWVVRGVERVDEENRQIWFRAGGIRPGQDPYYVHLCRVNFDGRGLVVLTEGDGTHNWTFSPDRRFFFDTYSRVDRPPITELRRSDDGRLVCRLEEADWSRLCDTPWCPPQRFVAKGRDGKTDIYGIIVRPTNFDPCRKYPVIEKIYAGPHSAHVPKSFGLLGSTYEMAELGFIVVQIDGMGTSHRSKAFHDVCWKNLGDAGFPDRIAWMKAAAEKHPEMDLSRVGIYGGSAGGQNALGGLLMHGDFYKAAAADCGCHDNRMDKIWWNELWMGWPIGPHYEEQSNVTQAHRLEGKLLLTVGELDRNVDPASTMQVVDALVKADKDFELLVVPGAGHGVGESPYGKRRRADFFVRHLLHVEPRWE